MKHRLSIRSNSLWARRELERLRSNAIITSPYLTSPAAEGIIGRADPKTAVVLTTFDAKTFAAGGSSLRTIRKLMGLGFELRTVEDLHAKLIVTEGAALVSSQNLTVAGTRNREATAWVSDPAEVARLRGRLKAWIDASKLITPEMVGQMEGLVGSLRKLAADLDASCAAADAGIRKAEEDRERLRREVDARHGRAAERARLRRTAARKAGTLSRAVKAAPVLRSVPLRLEQRASLSYGKQWGRTYWTLLAPPGTDMTRWASPRDGGPLLKKRNRYLVAVSSTGRLGWMALQKTRLTGFGDGVSRSGKVELDGVVYEVHVATNQEASTLAAWNIEFRLSERGGPQDLVLRGLFSLDGLKVRTISAGRGGTARKTAVRAHLREVGGLNLQLRKLALEPFRYARNGRAPVSSEKFCEGLDRQVVLKLRRHVLQPFFSLE